VDRTLQTSDKNIFAAGDCADAIHVVTAKKPGFPWPCGPIGRWAAADNVCGETVALQGLPDRCIQSVRSSGGPHGLTPAEAKTAGFNPAETTITARSRAHSHPGSSAIQCLHGRRQNIRASPGAQMVGREGWPTHQCTGGGPPQPDDRGGIQPGRSFLWPRRSVRPGTRCSQPPIVDEKDVAYRNSTYIWIPSKELVLL